MSEAQLNQERPQTALWEMISVAAPTVVTMTSYTAMQFVDGLMVSRIQPPDSVYVAAQGNGGLYVWMSMSFAMGLVSVINTYVAQNLGAGKADRGAFYAWAGLWLSLGMAILMIPLALAAPYLFSLMGHEDKLVEKEVVYAQIMASGAFFTLGARAISHYFYGMHRPTIVMISVIAANLLNVCVNAVLIFGPEGPPVGTPFAAQFAMIAQFLGTPAMGVRGAALGTVIGAVFEFAIPMLLFLGPRYNAEYQTRSKWRISWVHLKEIWKIGWPGGAMFLNELFCWGFLMAFAIGAAGAAAGEDPVVHNMAGWIALRYMHMAFMPAVGLSIAVTAIVGKCMGMQRPDLAAQRTWLGMKVTVVYMGFCAILFVIFREPMVHAFADEGLEPEVMARLIAVGGAVMIAAAVFQVFDATAITLSGALRGAGDTVWPGIATIVLSWTCIVGLGSLLMVVAPGLGSIGPWIGASAFIILLGIALLARFLGGKWRTIQLVEGSADDEVDADESVPTSETIAGMTPGQA